VLPAEANAWSGITSYYAELAAALESYSALQPEQARAGRGEARPTRPPQERAPPPAAGPWNLLLVLLLLALVLTSALNAAALHRLSRQAEEPGPPPPPAMHLEALADRPPGEWAELVERQAVLHSQRAAWLRHRLALATRHLAQAEGELARAATELDNMAAGGSLPGPAASGCDTKHGADLNSCDKDDKPKNANPGE
jgi:hypothetical protein